MSKGKRFLIGALLPLQLFWGDCQGLEALVDTTRPIVCDFSELHQNRIAVRGGFIKKAICLDPRVETEMEQDSGQVFVYLREPVEAPVIISCVTSGGYLQDIQASFLPNTMPQVVLLQEPIEVDEGDLASQKSVDRTVKLLSSLLRGELPAGYYPYGASEKKERISKALQVESRTQYQSAFELVEVIELRNCSKNEIQLKESDFAAEDLRWIYLSKDKIGPKSAVQIVLGREGA